MADSEPTRAEQARALVQARRYGVLCTSYHKEPGFPYGSTAGYGSDAQGRPIFFFSALSVHTKNLQADPRASFVVVDPAMESDPLDSPRVTLMGELRPVPEEEAQAASECWLGRHPDATYLLELGDFEFYRLEIKSIHWVGGFGGAGWPMASDYAAAKV
jgi:putative heme iron utilization protein